MMFTTHSVQEIHDTVVETGRKYEPSMALQKLKELYRQNMFGGKVTDNGFTVQIVVDPYETIRPCYFYYDNVFNA